VILAAGAGTRYGGLKQLAPVGPSAETLLEYSAFDAARAGFERIVLVVRPETERKFRDRLDGGMARCLPVAYVHQCLDDLPATLERPPERVKPWGTVQAVLAAQSQVDRPFAVVNADDFYGLQSYVTLSRFLSDSPEERRLAAVGFRVAETLTDAGPVSRGLLSVDSVGRLREIVEILEMWREGDRILYHQNGQVQALSGDELVSMNMWGFTPELLLELRSRFISFLKRSDRLSEAEFILPEVIRCLVREDRFRVDVLPGSGEWCGITFRQDHQRVSSTISSLVAQGRYPQELWA
jgi:NDP-sugar pyrophosphorylase family protein